MTAAGNDSTRAFGKSPHRHATFYFTTHCCATRQICTILGRNPLRPVARPRRRNALHAHASKKAARRREKISKGNLSAERKAAVCTAIPAAGQSPAAPEHRPEGTRPLSPDGDSINSAVFALIW